MFKQIAVTALNEAFRQYYAAIELHDERAADTAIWLVQYWLDKLAE